MNINNAFTEAQVDDIMRGICSPIATEDYEDDMAILYKYLTQQCEETESSIPLDDESDIIISVFDGEEAQNILKSYTNLHHTEFKHSSISNNTIPIKQAPYVNAQPTRSLKDIRNNQKQDVEKRTPVLDDIKNLQSKLNLLEQLYLVYNKTTPYSDETQTFYITLSAQITELLKTIQKWNNNLLGRLTDDNNK